MIIRSLLTTIFAAILTSGLVTAANAQVGGNATWRVQKYDIVATLPQDAKMRTVGVKAVLSLKNVSGAPASSLTLRISTLAEVTVVRINDSAADFGKSEEKINPATSLQRIAVRFGAIAPNAPLTATVEYKLNLKENTPLGSVTPNGAQFLPLSFWYPTPNSWFFTRGADTAPFSITTSKFSGLMTLSSGSASVVPGGSESPQSSNQKFEQKINGQPFFIAGNWEETSAGVASVYVPKGVGPEGQKRAAELGSLLAEARTFISGVLGPAPDVPFRIVASRRGAGFSGAATVIVDESVFRRSKIDSLTAMNIAEGVAKVWLGGSVAISGDGGGMVSEGLSRYIATQFLESKYGKDVADVERLRQRTAYAGVSKRDAPLNIVSPLDDFYFPEVANKGAMVWRILAKRVGGTEFADKLKSSIADGNLTLAELRSAFSANKDLLDYLIDQVTDMNLLVGLPQNVGAETRSVLRNTGATDVTVDVAATTDKGERIVAPTTIKAGSFGEVAFRTPNKVVRVEVDADKLYPQVEYSDDVAPRESTDSDPLLATKRYFDKQDFANAEKTARDLLRDLPRFDDLRILLGRSLLAQNRTTDAEKEFRAVLDEKLPTSRSLAWANVGLAEIASKANQKDAAEKFINAAIMADAEYGAGLAARNLRNKLGISSGNDATVKTFFADFDKAAVANRKADIDNLVMPGEVGKFASGVAGSASQWQTQIVQIDRLDATTVLVEANMSIKLLNHEVETGPAVYRLSKVGAGWRLSAVDMFEVR